MTGEQMRVIGEWMRKNDEVTWNQKTWQQEQVRKLET